MSNFRNERWLTKRSYRFHRAAPSRDLDNYDNWASEELDQYSLYRSHSNTRSSNYTAPYNSRCAAVGEPHYRLTLLLSSFAVISQRNVPKPGYSLAKKEVSNFFF